MKKSWLLLVTLLLLLLVPVVTHAKKVPIKVDTKLVKYDESPIMVNKVLYYPLRGIVEGAGGKMSWDVKTNTIIILRGKDKIQFNTTQNYAYVNGIKKPITKALIQNNAVWVPVQFTSSILGMQVSWNTKESILYVTTPTMVKINSLVKNAERYLGTPYRFGGTFRLNKTFDCSAFVQQVFAERGVYLPRTTFEQVKKGKKVTFQQLQKGDLIFFDIMGNKSLSHVAIYIDANTLLQASSSKGVAYTSFNSYWKTRMKEFRRIL
ncbi:hypothetical protein CN918_31940 [Priestia megaterium]|nr:hypothetical protein CN918_31940 [Priestia megaterium]